MEHTTDMPHCWCNPKKEVQPNGAMLIVHNDETMNWEESFDATFPALVKMSDGKTYKDVCGRDEVKAFIRETLLERDKFWQEQEMGVSNDCYEHAEQALLAQRQEMKKGLEVIREKYITSSSCQNALGEAIAVVERV